MLGVDEAGRGPLAGPVAVGAVRAAEGFDVAREFPGIADSKQLTSTKRAALFALLEMRAKRGDLRFVVEFESAETIDRDGIVPAVYAALTRALRVLAPDVADVFVRLDGALRAPREYRQETIVKGDERVPLISLASVAAKVARDRLMEEYARTYSAYGFDRHKGYGTAAHYRALAAHGPCVIHRRSFLHLD